MHFIQLGGLFAFSFCEGIVIDAENAIIVDYETSGIRKILLSELKDKKGAAYSYISNTNSIEYYISIAEWYYDSWNTDREKYQLDKFIIECINNKDKTIKERIFIQKIMGTYNSKNVNFGENAKKRQSCCQ